MFCSNDQLISNFGAFKMLFITSVVRKLNPPTVASKLKILSITSMNYSSSTGYTQEEIESFRKVFRNQPSYEESISSKDLTRYLQSINFVKSMETYQKHTEYVDKILGGRIEISQIMKYIGASHDPRLLMNEYLKTFDRNNDGFISKEEFEFGMEDLRVHDPRIKHISFEDFVKEADTNRDGKISVEECRDWLNKNLVPFDSAGK